jgi:hypothetical protein
MVVLVGIVMFAALIGMIICSKKQKTNPNAQPIAVALLIVVIGCGGFVMYKMGIFGGGGVSGIMENENRFACSKAYVLGKYLAKEYPGKKALIICDQGFKKNKRTQKIVEALGEGLGGKDKVVADTITVKASKDMQGPDGELVMPLEEIMTAKDFDAAVAKHADCALIVSMIGLPRDKKKMKLWSQKDKHLAMLNANIFDQKGLIKAGKICAAVSFKPGVKFTEDPAPSDLEEAFKVRFLLITSKNIVQMAQDNPKLFK